MERHSWCSPSDIECVKTCKLFLEHRDERIKWRNFYPEYGCVILGFVCTEQPPGLLNLEVLGLDDPVSTMHGNFLAETPKYDHFWKSSGKFVPLQVGTIDEGNLAAFQKQFSRCLASESGKRKREKHPYTPDFIRAVMQQAVETIARQERGDDSIARDVFTQGGFPDYERRSSASHMGNPPNTSFPLVCSLLQWVLSQNQSLLLYQNIMIYTDLRVSGMILDDVKKAEKSVSYVTSRQQLEWAKCILEAAARKIFTLAESKIDVSALLRITTELDQVVKATAYDLQDAEAQTRMLSNVEEDLNRPDAFLSFTLALPEKVDPDTKCDVAAIRSQACLNLGLVPVLRNCNVLNLVALDRFLSSPHFQAQKRLEDAQLIAATVEEAFWQRAERGLKTEVLKEAEITLLRAVIEKYLQVMVHVRTHLSGDHYMKTVGVSRELMVVWIAYCLAFEALRMCYGSLFANIGVALRYQDLEHCVFPEKRYYDLLVAVKDFLKERTVTNAELFSLRPSDTTFQFGVGFTEVHLENILQQEQRNSAKRVDNHWEKVQEKKRKAAKLDTELQSLQLRMEQVERSLNIAQKTYDSENTSYRNPSWATRRALDDAQEEHESLTSSVHSKESELEQTKKAPDPVVQPLPEDLDSMKYWIFFLHMPNSCRALATLSFTAQQLLVPCVAYGKLYGIENTTLEKTLLVTQPAVSIASHYNCRQSCYLNSDEKTYHVSEDLLRLYGNSNKIPNKIGPATIDDMKSPTYGVWYPSSSGARMAWLGSRHGYKSLTGKELDPFRIDRASTALYFTEQVNGDIQWAVTQDGNPSPERGNNGLATQGKRPHDLSRIDHVLLSSVRAFPHVQTRKAVLCFLNQSIPLEDLRFHKMLLQALFQVGALYVNSESPSPLQWKTDLSNATFLAAVKAILVQRESELRHSPTKSMAALLVGEVAAFFSSWDEDMKQISRNVARAAVQWADGVDKQIPVADEKDVDSLKGEQCNFLFQAILCFANGPVNDSDLDSVIRLTTRSYNLRMGLSRLAPEQEQVIDRHHSRCVEALSAKLHLLLDIATRNSDILTCAFREVVQVPAELLWSPFQLDGEQASSCFEAIGGDGCIYTINVFTGAVLVNGSPPASLPSAIYQHRLYKRTFGRSLFRVVPKAGVYETANHVEGRFYQFFHDGENLHVTEIDKISNQRLELLDSYKSSLWGSELPVRLRKLHSHWFCRTSDCVVLRGKMFRERQVSYILGLQLKFSGERVIGSCRSVPEKFEGEELSDIIRNVESFDELVKHNSAVTKGLERIEDSRFIHVIRRKSDICFDLPRLKLRFGYITGKEVVSEDFPDFQLSSKQLLPGILWGFSGYLVLEKRDSSKEKFIIFPEGEIAKSQGVTAVLRMRECDADQRWHRVDVHERLNFLHATDFMARVRLTALHLATSHAVPDRMTQMRGSERALELLRQSWTSVPLSKEEQGALLNCAALSAGRFPNAALLCFDVFQSSEQTSFLHPSKSSGDHSIPIEFTDRAEECTAYQCLRKQYPRNCRLVLTQEEELRVLGRTDHRADPVAGIDATIEELSCLFDERIVSSLQTDFASIVTRIKEPVSIDQFPFDLPDSRGALESSIFSELRASWDLNKDSTYINDKLHAAWSSTIGEIGLKVKLYRKKIEALLLEELNFNLQLQGFDFTLNSSLRLSNGLPTASHADLVRAAYKPSLLTSFSPFLSEAGHKKILNGIAIWLRCCVLEDKISPFDSARDAEALKAAARSTCKFAAHD